MTPAAALRSYRIITEAHNTKRICTALVNSELNRVRWRYAFCSRFGWWHGSNCVSCSLICAAHWHHIGILQAWFQREKKLKGKSHFLAFYFLVFVRPCLDISCLLRSSMVILLTVILIYLLVFSSRLNSPTYGLYIKLFYFV